MADEVSELSAVDDLILGRAVKRGRHTLAPEALARFRARLPELGYAETTVGAIDIAVGQRVPAWVVRGNTADFGWVFWEIFTERARRKLFGSEARNAKGDWDVQLYPTSKETLFAAASLRESYDASRPVGIY